MVEKHSWENIPEEEKGEGEFYHKASPGSWCEDLIPKQAEIVEHIIAPILEEFYPNYVSWRSILLMPISPYSTLDTSPRVEGVDRIALISRGAVHFEVSER